MQGPTEGWRGRPAAIAGRGGAEDGRAEEADRVGAGAALHPGLAEGRPGWREVGRLPVREIMGGGLPGRAGELKLLWWGEDERPYPVVRQRQPAGRGEERGGSGNRAAGAAGRRGGPCSAGEKSSLAPGWLCATTLVCRRWSCCMSSTYSPARLFPTRALSPAADPGGPVVSV